METELILCPNKEFEKIRGSQISMVFQEPMSSLNPSMKCGNQVLEALLKHTNSKAKQKVHCVF